MENLAKSQAPEGEREREREPEGHGGAMAAATSLGERRKGLRLEAERRSTCLGRDKGRSGQGLSLKGTGQTITMTIFYLC